MNRTWTIARREVGSYFASPIFWVLAAAFMAFGGLVFGIYVTNNEQPAQASMRPLLGLYATIQLFVTPLLAMRLLAEEQRSGTLELLMTSPVRDWNVVVGKWLAAFLVVAVIIGLTVFHVAVMSRLATAGIDTGPTLASYLGLFLLGAALLALGVLTSSVTENQVVAGFLGIMLVMVLWFLPLLAQMAGPDSAVGAILEYVGLSNHYMNFGQGLVDSRDVIYFVSITIGALYLATRVVETRRWR